ncbi:hypothetical protein ACVBBL_004483, partial [Escherichia coli]
VTTLAGVIQRVSSLFYCMDNQHKIYPVGLLEHTVNTCFQRLISSTVLSPSLVLAACLFLNQLDYLAI